jgi:hypothetical protein
MQSKNLGLLSPFVGSICCVGPALLAFLGLFGFAGGFFANYHWSFIAAGLIGVSRMVAVLSGEAQAARAGGAHA